MYRNGKLFRVSKPSTSENVSLIEREPLQLKSSVFEALQNNNINTKSPFLYFLATTCSLSFHIFCAKQKKTVPLRTDIVFLDY